MSRAHRPAAGAAWAAEAGPSAGGVLWEKIGKKGEISPGQCSIAFIGVYLYTLVLYARPGELFPGIFGGAPLAKFIALATPVAYLLGKLSSRREKLLIWPLELKMAYAMALIGIILTPLAISPRDSIDVLTEIYLKLLIIFTLLINLTDTRARLRSLIFLILICCGWLAIDTVKAFLNQDFYDLSGGVGRIEGAVGGLFSNPNDRATLFGMMLPLAVAIGLRRRGIRGIFYFAMAVLFMVGVIASYSRGGFLGMAVGGGVVIWKLRKTNRWIPKLAAVVMVVFLVVAIPGGYGERLMTIFNPDADKTESAQGRKRVLERAIILSIRHSIVGLGVGNFHIYSFRELRAHNAYFETAAELGAIGLLAYLIMIIKPVRDLKRIESRSHDLNNESERENYYLSVGLQGTFFCYFVCSFFSSIQYDWYIYYPIVYAIALRRITRHEAQQAGIDIEDRNDDASAETKRGVLWRPKRTGVLMTK